MPAMLRRLPSPGGGRAVVLALASLVILFWPGFVEHVQDSSHRFVFTDDARQQVAPFLLEAAAGGEGLDYISAYYLDCMPRGYSQGMRVAQRVGDARVASKVLPSLLFAVVLLCVGLAARDLGGVAVMWGSLALLLGSSVFFTRMTGGLPRAFAFPLVAFVALALVRGRPAWVALATVLGALFYYPIAVLSGLVLAVDALVDRSAEGRRHRWGLVLGTAVVTVLVAIPAIRAAGTYGPALGPADVAAYPEAGERGRFTATDVAGGATLEEHLTRMASQTFVGNEELAFLPPVRDFVSRNAVAIGRVLLGLVVLVSVPLARTDRRMRRLLALPIAAFAGYLLADLLAPRLFLPGRYVTYGLPVFCCLALPAGLASAAGSFRRFRAGGLVPPVVSIVGVGLVVLLFGGRGPGSLGFTMTITGDHRAMVEEVASLPPDVLLAGWPFGVANNAPYLAARPVLLNHETHLPLHAQYADEMRRRTSALLAAYFAADPGPLVALREEYGVTHLVVDRRHYAERPPRHFPPFDVELEQRRAALTGEPEALRQIPFAGVAEHGPYVLLDLARVASTPPVPADPGED